MSHIVRGKYCVCQTSVFKHVLLRKFYHHPLQHSENGLYLVFFPYNFFACTLLLMSLVHVHEEKKSVYHRRIINSCILFLLVYLFTHKEILVLSFNPNFCTSPLSHDTQCFLHHSKFCNYCCYLITFLVLLLRFGSKHSG